MYYIIIFKRRGGINELRKFTIITYWTIVCIERKKNAKKWREKKKIDQKSQYCNIVVRNRIYALNRKDRKWRWLWMTTCGNSEFDVLLSNVQFKCASALLCYLSVWIYLNTKKADRITCAISFNQYCSQTIDSLNFLLIFYTSNLSFLQPHFFFEFYLLLLYCPCMVCLVDWFSYVRQDVSSMRNKIL